MPINKERFFKQFRFKKHLDGYFGIERERFLEFPNGKLAPLARRFLENTSSSGWICELSACQVENITHPYKNFASLKKELDLNDKKGNIIAQKMGVKISARELAPKNMPMNICSNRQCRSTVLSMTKLMREVSFRIADTHFHLGTESLEKAIFLHNFLRPYILEFYKLADYSEGKRFLLYKKASPDCFPPHYKNPDHFLKIAIEQGFADNPKQCGHLLRISIHGTVEMRMFGSTENNEKTIGWLKAVRRIVKTNF